MKRNVKRDSCRGIVLGMGYYIGKNIRRTLAEWTAVPFGLLLYGGIRKKDCYDVIICNHIGDFLYTVSYLKEFKEQNQIAYLRIISTKRFAKLALLFPEVCEEYRSISETCLERLLFSYRYPLGRKIYHFMENVKLVEPASDFADRYGYVEAFPNLNLEMCIKYGILKLSEQTVREYPFLNSEKQKDKKRVKKVLLCPAAAIIEWKNYESFFVKLAAKLAQENISVYINDMKNSEISEKKPLEEFIYFTGEMDCVVGIRSGLLDLAAAAGCGVLALYPKEYELRRYFDLCKMNPYNQKIMECELSDDLEKDAEEIFRILIKQGE